VLPDRFIDHDSQPRQIADAGLSARDIVRVAMEAAGMGAAAVATGTGTVLRAKAATLR
jgi:hypothetical protein